MLNKSEMQKFASQFVTGKVKIKKNEHIHGKSDIYYVTQNGLFVQFEDHSIIVKVPNVGVFLDRVFDVTPTLRNYINNINKLIEVENKTRISHWPQKLNGTIYTEISFKIKENKQILSKFTLTIYPFIRSMPTDFGGMIIDLAFHINNEHLIIDFESNQTIVRSDLCVLTLPMINEILDFKNVLDEVFMKQLNTLEMALL
jgi:hypothetical protein